MLHLEIPEQFTLIMLTIESLFVIGALAFFSISRKKTPSDRSKLWLKYGTYFVIMHGMLFSMLYRSVIITVSLLIVLCSLFEIITLIMSTDKKHFRKLAFTTGYLLCAILFILFIVHFPISVILFVFLTCSICDSFSQICGQLFGRHQLAPKISPSKTIEGASGGFLVAVLFAGFVYPITMSTFSLLLSGVIIALSSIFGDLACSWFKRVCAVKDFSKLLPGQGGVLDRFNSFIAASSVMYLFRLLFPV